MKNQNFYEYVFNLPWIGVERSTLCLSRYFFICFFVINLFSRHTVLSFLSGLFSGLPVFSFYTNPPSFRHTWLEHFFSLYMLISLINVFCNLLHYFCWKLSVFARGYIRCFNVTDDRWISLLSDSCLSSHRTVFQWFLLHFFSLSLLLLPCNTRARQECTYGPYRTETLHISSFS